MSRNLMAVGAPVSITLGDAVYVLSRPTAADELTIEAEFKRQCIAESKTPLQSILDDISKMPPAVAKLAIEAAVNAQASSAGGIVDPDTSRVSDRLFHPHGAAFRFWWLARKNHPGLKLDEIVAKITIDNVMDVVASMFEGLLDDDDDKKKQATSRQLS